ncbi:MAG: DUF5777 family beta-barrel protein [Bacteroidota bacterium]
MKHSSIKFTSFFSYTSILLLCLLCGHSSFAHPTFIPSSLDSASETNSSTETPKSIPVKNTFESNLLIDAQSVMVPTKGTLEFDIQHRFGIVNNGYSDFYGLFSPAIIRLGIAYVPINNLQIGIGLCSDRMQVDLNAKYAIAKQKKNGLPISITYYGNIAMDTRSASDFVTNGDRLSYFNQLMIARKITSKLSLQAAISCSHFNNVVGYIAPDGAIKNTVNNDQFTLSFMGRYKITNLMSILVDYDQPLTQNTTNNPRPDLAFGLEIITSSHCFQIIVANSQYSLPQNSAMYNQNDYSKGQYLIGFNMTKLWNF